MLPLVVIDTSAHSPISSPRPSIGGNTASQRSRDRLRRAGSATFSLLVADCDNTLEVVARFLALLELYREGLVEFEQPVSLDELTVRWIGGDAPDSDLEIDDYEGTRISFSKMVRPLALELLAG